MALTTANSKLRSTLLFPNRDAQVFFKLATADLADASGLTPSTLVLKLCCDAVAHTEDGRHCAGLMYSGHGSCLSAFEAQFQGYAAIQPNNTAKPLVEAFFAYANRHRIRFSTCDERVYHLRSNWKSVVSYVTYGIAPNEIDPRLVSKRRNGEDLLRVLEPEGVLTSPSSHISYIIENWDALSKASDTYRVLMDLAYMSNNTTTTLNETAEERLALLGLIDRISSGSEKEART